MTSNGTINIFSNTEIAESTQAKTSKGHKRGVQRCINSSPNDNICTAIRATGVRCIRHKKIGDFCGTHAKNTTDPNVHTTRIDIWTHDFGGIIYYIDANCNVYKPEDIMNNIVNPAVIYKYEIGDDGTQTICYDNRLK
jgi:hypothetical protein